MAFTADEIAAGVIVDLSSNNVNPADIDWALAAQNGLIAVFDKATQATDYTNPFYMKNGGGARSAGLGFAAYHYAGFGNATAEADYFWSVAGSDAKMVDAETSSDAAWIESFLVALNEPADEELAYGSASSLPRSGLRSFLFPADYGKNPGFGDCWQYTDSGIVPGIPGDVDLSKWIGSAAHFYTFFGLTPPQTYSVVKPLVGKVGTMNAPVVAILPTLSGKGYTLVGSDGGTFNYGDAKMLGSLASLKLNAPIVDAVRTPDGKGLVLVATDGGVFTLGDAKFEGSEGGKTLTAPVVSVALTATGEGWWLTGADGSVFAFGDATFEGSPA